MTRLKIVGIIAGVILIAGVIVFGIWMSQFDVLPEEEDVSSSVTIDYDNETLIIYSCNVNNILYFTVTNPETSFTVFRNEDGNVRFKGYEDTPLMTYSSAGLFESVTRISCLAMIEENAQNLEYYGLDDPQVTVEIFFEDESTMKFFIGDAAPQGGGYYLILQDSNDVYLAQDYFSERFLKKRTDYYYLDFTYYYEFMAEGFQSLRIDRPEGQEDFYMRATTDEEATDVRYISGGIVEEPFHWGGNTSAITDILTGIAGIKAQAVCADVITDDVLEYFQLDDANRIDVTLEMWVDTSNYVSEVTSLENPYYGKTKDGSDLLIQIDFHLGLDDAGYRYLMLNDLPFVFAVKSDIFSWVENSVDFYCEELVSIRYLNELQEIVISCEGQDYDFTFTDPDLKDDMEVLYNGFQSIDQSSFRNLYVSLISVSLNGLADEEPDETDEPILTVRYIAKTERLEDDIVLKFFKMKENERKIIVQIDGEGRFYVYITKVNKIINDMHKLINGEILGN